jgi:hypothetical protein
MALATSWVIFSQTHLVALFVKGLYVQFEEKVAP